MSSKQQQPINKSITNISKDDFNSVSNCKKLKLLLWKNWLLQWNNKIQLLLVLLLPTIYVLLMVYLRTLVKPIQMPESHYSPQSIDDLKLYLEKVTKGNRILHENGSINFPIPQLCYTPDSPSNRAIIVLTVLRLHLPGWRAYDTASHMEYDLVKHNYIAGVQFQPNGMTTEENVDSSEMPLSFNYTLRFPSELRTMQGSVIETWRTNSLYPGHDITGPRNQNESDGGVPVGYLREGFLPLQHALTISWLQLASRSDLYSLPKVQLQRFPYKPHIFDELVTALQPLLPFMMLLSFIYPCAYITKYVTNEKELQLKEVMKLMGLHNWLHWTAWFMKSYILLMLVVALVVSLLMIKFYASVAILTYSQVLPIIFFMHTYVVASIWFCFMLAVFFSKASTAAAVSAIILFLTYIPYCFAYYYYERLNLSHKLILCLLLSNTALGFGIHLIMALEGTGQGLRWDNMFQPVSEDDSMTVFYVILMMMLATPIYMCICLYVEQIFPGEYGVPRRWDFLFRRHFWRHFLGLLPRSSDASISEQTFSYTDTYEQVSDVEPLNVGIELRNLQKRFGNRMAVKGLTLNMYRDEITVLLGHNGAGKTTTILMLTGIIPPTAGTAIINNCDIRTQLDCSRNSLGICPQHNVLFDGMSVRNHIIFFSSLKGVHGKEALQREVDKYTKIMELSDKSHVIAAHLSGGQKRKLSLCCALCGNTKTVLCDEPSSGVDAAARRRLWDLLQAEKAGRTVLLTTHHMDEADVLGDRIAILCEGQLQCYGTTFFLKKRYGAGYKLICVKHPGCDVGAVTALLAKHMPAIEPESDLGSELTYRLPSAYARQYADILSDLEINSERLGLSGHGVSVATMEEVFMSAGAEYREEAGQDDVGAAELKKDLILDASTKELLGSARSLMRWQALLIKKLLITYRNLWLLITQLLVPVIVVALTIINTRGGRIYYELPAMHISLQQYRSAYVVLDELPGENTTKLAAAYREYVKTFGDKYQLLNASGVGFGKFALRESYRKSSRVDFQYMAGATIGDDAITVWLNNKPLHTAPLTLNLLHNAWARSLLGEKAYTGINNAPLPYSNDTRSMRLNKGQRLGAEIAVNMCLAMCFVTAFYVMPVIKERETRAKLLQYLSGVSVWSYWCTHLLWDYMIFIIATFLTIFTIVAFQELGYSTATEMSRYLYITLIFGLAAMPQSYLMARLFADGATGFTLTAMFNTLSGPGLFTLVVALSYEAFKLKAVADKLAWYFRIFPHYCLASGLHHIHIGFNIRRGCSMASTQIPRQFKLCRLVPICCETPDYFAWSWPGVLPEVVYLLVMAVVMMTLRLLIDAKKFEHLREVVVSFMCYFCRRARRATRGAYAEPLMLVDVDIVQERQLVAELTSSERQNIPLVVNNICKRYGRHLAVKDLSFHVLDGECFGLLGVNGAGKTSTFKMLTGDTKITSGVAYVEGINLRTHMRKAYARIGYCPQFDALFEDLTGRETMRIHCMLRGVQRRYNSQICQSLARCFGFLQHIDKPTKHYSGGNKRKLSAALAQIGNPTIMYLDEPSSGMDPGARRQLWDMVTHLRQAGRSIVFTSHSMEECEALCTRLAIMVSGEFKCMGSTQHLKNKFSKGLILKLKVMPVRVLRVNEREADSISQVMLVKPKESDEDQSTSQQSRNKASQTVIKIDVATTTEKQQNEYEKSPEKSLTSLKRVDSLTSEDSNENRIAKVKNFIQRKIPDAVLQEEYQGLLTYYVPIKSIRWSEIFRLVERNRTKLKIEDYLISQTTLEEIFLEFARETPSTTEETRRKRFWCC